MKKITVLIGLFVLCFASISLAEDAAGWGDTRWGMSREDILKMFADQIEKDRWDGIIELKERNIGGVNLVVRFMFGDGLNKVVLDNSVKNKNWWDYKKGFNNIRELLIQKYGTPATEDSKIGYKGIIIRKAVWFSGRNKIELSLYDDLFSVMYTPNESAKGL